MVVQVIEHVITRIREDLDEVKIEMNVSEERKKQYELKLHKLLAEMLETERIYVQDLEEVLSCRMFQG